MSLEYILEKIGLHVSTVLLPNNQVDMGIWGTIAVDLFTLEYWKKVDREAKGKPSTRHLIHPEVYLDLTNMKQVKQNIRDTGKSYLEDGILVSKGDCFVAIDRETPYVKSRKGLVVALDLEKYGQKGLVRPTEGTIPKRCDSRKELRESLAVEVSHSIVLINDPKKTVIESLFDESLEEKLYDFKLMMGGGRIKGYKINNPETIKKISKNIENLIDHGFWGIIGDGNHGIESAYRYWKELKEKTKDKQAIMNHPARYALVELMNIHDEGVQFYPIHKLVLNTDINEMLRQMKSFYNGKGSNFSYINFKTEKGMQKEFKKLKHENTHLIKFVAQNNYGILIIKNPKSDLEVGTLQSFLDEYKKYDQSAIIKYSHEEKEVSLESKKPKNIGFYLPAMAKETLFDLIIQNGELSPKAFAVGKSPEKVYYCVARKLLTKTL